MDASAKIEKESTRPSEKPFSREEARVYLESLTLKVDATKVDATIDQGIQKKLAAEAELRKLSKQQLESLNQTTVEKIGLPENVQKMVDSIDLRTLILNETNRQREALKQEVAKSRAVTGKDNEKAEAGKKDDATDKAWIPDSLDPSTWNGRQISVASTATLGAAGLLYLAWKKWRQPKPNPETPAVPGAAVPKKNRVLAFLSWIPVVGLGATALYAAHKMLLKFDPYTKAFATMQEKYEQLEKKTMSYLEKGKELLPFGGKSNEEKYGLIDEDFADAEASYKKTRGADLVHVRNIFKLKDGETSPEYESFIQDMKAKYDVQKDANNVAFVRGDVALDNYEKSLIIGLRELDKWIGNHMAEITAAGIVLQQTGLIRISDIIRGSAAIAVKCTQIAAELGKMIARHPLLSLFAAGGSILAMKGTNFAARKIYLPENLEELGKAFSNGTAVVMGDVGDSINNQMLALKDSAMELAKIGGDFTSWVGKEIQDFGGKVITAAPEAFGLTEEEMMQKRNGIALDELQGVIESSKAIAGTSTEKAKENTIENHDNALAALASYRRELFAERLEKVTESDAPEKALIVLTEALKVIGVELETRDGIVRWNKEGNEEQTDLSVDPSIKNKERLHALSDQMREGSEGNGSYIFFRALQHLREKEQESTERGLIFTDSKVAAMVIGNFVYFTDPGNEKDYWTAPLSEAGRLFDLVGKTTGLYANQTSWSEEIADFGNATVDATLMSLNMAAFSRLKRMAFGGGKLLSNPLAKHNWSTTFGSINPLTSPIKLVRDAARGIIDLETFWKLGKWGESGGRYFNTLLAAAEVRPEWIGVIEDGASSLKELKHVAGEVGVVKINGLSEDALREVLRKQVLRKLRHVDTVIDVATAKKGTAANYEQMYQAAAEWYKTRSKVSRFVGGISKGIEVASNPIKKIYEGGRKGLMWTAEKAGKLVVENKYVEAALKALKINKAAFMLKLAPFLKLGKFAKVAAGPLSVVGLGALCLWLETEGINAEIEQTDSSEVKDLLKNRKEEAKVGTALGAATGLAITLGSKAALPLLPVYITYEAANATKKYFETATIEWLKTDKDMLRSSPAELRKQLRETGPGQQNYAQQNAARKSTSKDSDNILGGSLLEQVTGLGNGEERYRKVEQANNGQRGKITRAYLSEMSALAPEPRETEVQYNERYAKFMLAQERYIAEATDKKFALVSADTYVNAHDHAELKQLSEQLKEKGEESPMTLVSIDGTGNTVLGETFDLAEYNDLPPNGKVNEAGISRGDVIYSWNQQKRTITVAMASILKESQSGGKPNTEKIRTILKQRMLTDVRHELARFDERLGGTNLTEWTGAWGWTGGEEARRDIVRFAAYTEFKRVLDQEGRVLEMNPSPGLSDINASIGRLQSFLEKNIDEFVKLADRSDTKKVYEEFVAKENDPKKVLDWRTIAEEMIPAKNQQSRPANTTPDRIDPKAFKKATEQAA